MRLARILSGGQTGINRGALDAALAWGFPCSGWCPPGRLAEDGRIPERYPLIEIKEGGYRQRTLRNVLESDGTAILYFAQIEGEAFATLRSHPYNRTRRHQIKKLENVSPGKGQYRLHLGRWRFRYDIEGQDVVLYYCGLRREDTYWERWSKS